MGITFQQTNNQGKITLDGEVTLSEAELLRSLLIKAIIACDEVHVDFGSLARIDLSCLQLLCSAHRSAVRLDKRLTLAGNWPAPFREMVNGSGFKRTCGCRLDRNNSCLWMEK
jgi:anti-anti-sigma regulatory factor